MYLRKLVAIFSILNNHSKAISLQFENGEQHRDADKAHADKNWATLGNKLHSIISILPRIQPSLSQLVQVGSPLHVHLKVNLVPVLVKSQNIVSVG